MNDNTEDMIDNNNIDGSNSNNNHAEDDNNNNNNLEKDIDSQPPQLESEEAQDQENSPYGYSTNIVDPAIYNDLDYSSSSNTNSHSLLGTLQEEASFHTALSSKHINQFTEDVHTSTGNGGVNTTSTIGNNGNVTVSGISQTSPIYVPSLGKFNDSLLPMSDSFENLESLNINNHLPSPTPPQTSARVGMRPIVSSRGILSARLNATASGDGLTSARRSMDNNRLSSTLPSVASVGKHL
jgi:hypothetical protein